MLPTRFRSIENSKGAELEQNKVSHSSRITEIESEYLT
jgi:hypothetical protein